MDAERRPNKAKAARRRHAIQKNRKGELNKRSANAMNRGHETDFKSDHRSSAAKRKQLARNAKGAQIAHPLIRYAS